jgi:hypothetical protein
VEVRVALYERKDGSRLSLTSSSVPGLGKERLEALMDGILATVMTVLVLSLSVPLIAPGSTNADVAAVLAMLVPNIVSYVLGFILLAVLWISHHNVFHYMTRVDRPLLWLNTLFLLSIGFLPFSTALTGKYHDLQIPVTLEDRPPLLSRSHYAVIRQSADQLRSLYCDTDLHGWPEHLLATHNIERSIRHVAAGR